MPKKSKLLEKLLSKPAPTSFTIRELYRYHVKMVIVFLKEVGEIE